MRKAKTYRVEYLCGNIWKIWMHVCYFDMANAIAERIASENKAVRVVEITTNSKEPA